MIESAFDMRSKDKFHETAAIVPATGIYRVVHTSHRLPQEVVLLKDERFPRCARCKQAVLFDLVHAAPDLFGHCVFKIYELPVIEKTDIGGAEKATA